MKKLLFAAPLALCVLLAASSALGQVAYTDHAPTGERLTVPAAPQTPLPTRGQTTPVGATFTTPAGVSPYAAATNNLIANNATNTLVVPIPFAACLVAGGNGGYIGARIKTTDTGFAGKKVILKLHRDAPTYTNGDHGTWLTTESIALPSISVTLSDHYSDAEKGYGTPDNNGTANGRSIVGFDCAPTSQNIYGELVAGEAITPQGGKVFSVVLEVTH